MFNGKTDTQTEVKLVREAPVKHELTIHHATATFIDGTSKDYTFHQKETRNNTIYLYEHNLNSIIAHPTKFSTLSIEHNNEQFSEKVPLKPETYFQNRTEKEQISLETCKDFTINHEKEKTITVTYDNWSACVDMPKNAAQAYQEHFGHEETYTY